MGQVLLTLGWFGPQSPANLAFEMDLGNKRPEASEGAECWQVGKARGVGEERA